MFGGICGILIVGLVVRLLGYVLTVGLTISKKLS